MKPRERLRFDLVVNGFFLFLRKKRKEGKKSLACFVGRTCALSTTVTVSRWATLASKLMEAARRRQGKKMDDVPSCSQSSSLRCLVLYWCIIWFDSVFFLLLFPPTGPLPDHSLFLPPSERRRRAVLAYWSCKRPPPRCLGLCYTHTDIDWLWYYSNQLRAACCAFVSYADSSRRLTLHQSMECRGIVG